jgi:23S rRNA (uridine2552-2'-O)-methyltransferase
MAQIPGVKILQLDFLDPSAPAQLLEAVGGTPDLVVSDMAAPTTGHHRTDHLRTMHLCEVAAHFAVEVLGEGGHFLAKTFQGGAERDLLTMLKQHFKQVVHVKPASSRAESVEMFLLAKGFKGRKAQADLTEA